MTGSKKLQKYLKYAEKYDYSPKSLIPLIIHLNPYLSHSEVIEEAKKCSKLLEIIAPKYRKVFLLKAIKKSRETKEIGELGAMFLSAFLGAVIGNTIGILIRKKTEKWIERVGLG